MTLKERTARSVEYGVTVTVDGEAYQVDSLAVRYPTEVETLSAASATISGVSAMTVTDALITYSDGTSAAWDEIEVDGFGEATVEGDEIVGMTDSGRDGIAPVLSDDANSFNLAFSTTAEDFSSSVTVILEASGVDADGVAVDLGSATLSGDDDGLHLSASFEGVEECEVALTLRGEILLQDTLPCDDIGTVGSSDKLIPGHFLTDFHETDDAYIWTWGFSVVDVIFFHYW
ncbi:MAG: hypothetical protein AAFV53_36000 [Myxococcota bacterium]